jgi:hypothetical protein
MKIVLKDALINYQLSCEWTSGFLKESINLLAPREAVGSLALTTERGELQHFLFMRHNTLSKIYVTEPIPGKMIQPSNFKAVMLSELRKFLCEWYMILYEKEEKDILGFMDLHINQHAGLQIGSEIFGSMLSGRQEKKCYHLCKMGSSSTDIYPGEVQYYLEHKLRLPEGSKTHLLAYVKWYKNAPSSDTRFKHRFMEPDISNTEL